VRRQPFILVFVLLALGLAIPVARGVDFVLF
jgi:hypothetical protein